MDKHAGDAIRTGTKIVVGPGNARCKDARARSMSFMDSAIQQLSGTVEPRRKLQLRKIKDELGQQFWRWEVIAREGIDVSCGHATVQIASAKSESAEDREI
jgi:hypothetical protein